MMHGLLLDKEFWTHITSYQATINPEKIDEHFKQFKRAFYPHLEEYEERQSKERQKKLIESAKKGSLIKFRPEKLVKEHIRELRQEAVKQAKEKTRFSPEPRRNR